MTLTEFELGALAAKVKELEHRIRNVQAIANAISEEHEETRLALARLRVEIRTAVSIVAAAASLLAFFWK